MPSFTRTARGDAGPRSGPVWPAAARQAQRRQIPSPSARTQSQAVRRDDKLLKFETTRPPSRGDPDSARQGSGSSPLGGGSRPPLSRPRGVPSGELSLRGCSIRLLAQAYDRWRLLADQAASRAGGCLEQTWAYLEPASRRLSALCGPGPVARLRSRFPSWGAGAADPSWSAAVAALLVLGAGDGRPRPSLAAGIEAGIPAWNAFWISGTPSSLLRISLRRRAVCRRCQRRYRAPRGNRHHLPPGTRRYHRRPSSGPVA